MTHRERVRERERVNEKEREKVGRAAEIEKDLIRSLKSKGSPEESAEDLLGDATQKLQDTQKFSGDELENDHK